MSIEDGLTGGYEYLKDRKVTDKILLRELTLKISVTEIRNRT